MTVIATTTPLGFGCYPLQKGETFPQMQVSDKVHKIFFTLFYSAVASLSLAIIPISWPLGLAAFAGFSYVAIRSLLGAIGAFYRSAPLRTLFPNGVEADLTPIC